MINYLSFRDYLPSEVICNCLENCENYLSFSTCFKVIGTLDESIPPLSNRHFLVVKNQVPQNIMINVLKFVSYCTLVLPIIMLLGKLLMHLSYKFTDVAVFNNQEAWKSLTPVQKIHIEKLLFRLSLDEWLNNPNATGLKDSAAETIWECYLNKDERLDLRGFKLNSIPLAIENMKHLRSLNLSANNFKTVPDGIFKLTDLEHLDLSSNELSVISDNISNLTKLVILHLFENQLTIIPTKITNLNKLTHLILGSNRLTELPTEIGQLINLRYLFIENNQLFAIPTEIGNLTQLSRLSAHTNKLVSIPSTIGKLTQLTFLSLHKNRLLSIPTEIGNLINLKFLYLQSNRLTSIPVSIGNLINLVFLYLHFNQLTTLPASIGNLIELKDLCIGNNQLSTLPVQTGNLIDLRILELQNNSHLNRLPLSLGNLEDLTYLDIQGTGIPMEIRNMILESCENNRKKTGILRLPDRLKVWFKLAGKNLTTEQLDIVDTFTQSEKSTLYEWLVRLENSADFGSRESDISAEVCQMLETVLKDEDFRDSFFTQAAENNSNCGDRASMAFEELYIGWIIHTQFKNKAINEQLQLMEQTAKAITLRNLVSKKITEYQEKSNTVLNESVEIYLYFLVRAKETQKIDLISCMQSMKHTDLGQVEWIKEDELFDEVNQSYVKTLFKFSAFEKLLGDHNFKKKYQDLTNDLDAIDQKYRLIAEKHDKKKPQQEDLSPEFLDWRAEFYEIKEALETKKIERIQKELNKTKKQKLDLD